jgi:peroxidase
MSTHNFPRIIAGLLLVTAVSATADDLRRHAPPQVGLLREFRRIGGVRNNLQNPSLNAVPGTPEIALAPLNYTPDPKNGSDHLILPGPNPRTMSNEISGGTGLKKVNAETTDLVASAWLYVFGQFLDHDIGLEAAPLSNTKINISIPFPDPNQDIKQGTVIPMNRASRDPDTNTIINTTAGYLDLSQLYGSDTGTATSLRNPDGTLKTSNEGTALPLDPTGQYFISGDPRVMENPELTATTILFMREHNFWVHTLKTQHPNWTGDQLYHMAKEMTTGEYQNIIYKEFLPLLIGNVLGPYRGYNPTVNAQSSQEFSTAAFRVGHSQISGEQTGINNDGTEAFHQSLNEAFGNTAQTDIDNGINPLLRNLGTDPSQATDVYAVNELRNLLVAGLVGGGVDTIDLIAIDIQRVRDVGLASLNQTRIALHLDPYRSFSQLTSDPILSAKLDAIYDHQIGNVDLFIGGLAEDHAPHALCGSTFQAIIRKQFDALRAGDRFFWANEGFDPATAALIASTTLADLLVRNTGTPRLQDNVFLFAALPPLVIHVKHHFPWPGVINGHGRPRPFIHD